MFSDAPELILHDPLAEFLGAGDGLLRYRFEDAVKLAGHACPTVAGAFLLVHGALQRLYAEGETPQRGGLRVSLHGAVDEGANGPLSQVITLLTGAAADNGFHGLAGRFVRHGLLDFTPDDGALRCTFTRVDNGRQVCLRYDASAIALDAEAARLMPQVVRGVADADATLRFRAAWRDRVTKILADGGRQTVQEI